MTVCKRLHRFGNEVRRPIDLLRCVGALAIMLVAALIPAVVSSAECPAPREPSIPPLDGPIAKGFNIDTYKRQLEHFPSALNRRDSQPLSRKRIWGN